jgi:hypothetical protein
VPALTGQVKVSLAPANVFEYVADLTHGPLWIPYVSQVQPTSEETSGTALEADVHASVAGRELRGSGRCLEWDPPLFFSFETRFDDGARSLLEVEIEPVDTGSVVYATVDITLSDGGVGARAAGLVAERMLKQELRKAMAALKQQLEVRASA